MTGLKQAAPYTHTHLISPVRTGGEEKGSETVGGGGEERKSSSGEKKQIGILSHLLMRLGVIA